MIATGYLPYQFSENLCNAKLVYALQKAGYEVDVISKKDDGTTYDCEWKQEWLPLKHSSHTLSYPLGNKFERLIDVAYSGIVMGGDFSKGVRWMRRAYQEAMRMIKENHYDVLLTRSPSDASHYVGKKLKESVEIKWIANWNDPATPIWPKPYKHYMSAKMQRASERKTAELLRAADINTFPSDSLRKHFVSYFPFLEDMRTEVIPHIALSDDLYQYRTSSPHEILTMVHSGNMSAERNPEYLFKAMRALVDEGLSYFRLDIMGTPNPLTSQLIEKYNLNKYVNIVGSFTYLEAVDKLQDYDVMVLLEAVLEKGIFFASKITDYSLTGKPILAISPACGFAKDLITKHKGGVVCDNTSVSSIKDALIILLQKWRDGTISDLNSHELYREFSPETIVKIYSRL